MLRLGGSWTEGAVTWANQPATTGSAATTSSGTGYRDWNVACQVHAMYSSANNGFLVRDATENQDAEQQFHSREHSQNRPQLVLQLGSGPPPPARRQRHDGARHVHHGQPAGRDDEHLRDLHASPASTTSRRPAA